MFKPWWALRLGFGAIVLGVIGCVPPPLFAQAPAASSSKPSPAANRSPRSPVGAPRDDLAKVMGIVWYRNQIESVAIAKLWVPPKGPGVGPLPLPPIYDPIRTLLEKLRAALGPSRMFPAGECRYGCPPGEVCSPDCRPRSPRFAPESRPWSLESAVALVHWHANAIESAALELLMANPKAYTEIRKQLSATLADLEGLK
jgi:hypothetical protein